MMSNTSQRHFQLLASQFESLLQNLSECQDAEVRRAFLTNMRLVLDEVYEIELGESPSLELEDPPPDLDARLN
jgi:hypothetical protein